MQFLYLANNRTNAFLANEGVNLLNAWLNTGMAEPFVMASTTWGTAPAPPCGTPGTPASLTAQAGRKSVSLTWRASSPAPTGGYRIYYNQAGKLQFRASVGPTTLTYKDSGLTSRVQYCYVVTAWNDCNGNGAYDAGVDTESAPSNQACATAQ
ncbi:MAG: fibronectin type III domain-containing protein [Anaerolineae bacterium]|nr:fibronectin type III domain-containing protein [Anaerolineae bacterium]